MLEFNNQYVPKSVSELEERCAEGMIFGALLPCPTCNNVAWEYRTDGYHCRGHINEWLPCTNVTKDPPRTTWKVPDDLKDNPAFEKYKFKSRARIFPTMLDSPSVPNGQEDTSAAGAAVAAATLPKSAKDIAPATAASAGPTPMDTDASKGKNNKPLSGLLVASAGKLSMSHGQVQAIVEELGATFVPSKLGSHVTCLLTTQAEVQKNSKKVQEANQFGVPIVTESWLTESKSLGKCALLQKHLLTCSSVVVEPSSGVNVPVHLKDELKSRGVVVADDALPATVKVVVKGRAAVDPASELADSHHVLEEGDEIWNASLSNVDLRSGLNSYYKLQILVHDTNKFAALFRSWGRTGTTRGGTKVEHMGIASAKAQFKELFLEKTGNSWDDRKQFVKIPNKFFPLEIDYTVAVPKTEGVTKGSRTQLPKPVQDLVRKR